MLLQGPATGYGLRQRIVLSVGNFWQESFGQLYPTLTALAEDGSVRAVARKTERAGAQAYEITARGRRALQQWLARAPQPQPERNELLLKVFFAELAPSTVRAHVKRARVEAEEGGRRLSEVRADLTRQLADHPSLPAWLATVDFGVAGQHALRAWCERTDRALARLPKPHGSADHPLGPDPPPDSSGIRRQPRKRFNAGDE